MRGAASVSPIEVTVAVAWAVSPSAFVAVTRAVNAPAAYVCWTEGPSAVAPSPRSQW